MSHPQSPINPSDVNTVQGKYPIQPTNGIPGHEGVGRVIERGSEVRDLSVLSRKCIQHRLFDKSYTPLESVMC